MIGALETNLTQKDRGELQKLLNTKNGKKFKAYKYIFVTLICFLGLLLKIFLIKTINYPESGFLISTGTIMISAWYGGLRTGLLATVINYVISDYFFITPKKFFFEDTLADQVRYTLFLTEGVLISWLFESLHKSHQKTREALYKIYQNEKLVRSLIENVKDYAIFMVDARGFIRTWNKGATAMTGYPAEEILNESLSTLFPKWNSRNNVLKYLKIAKEKGEHKQEGWKMRKGDSLFWTETIISSLPITLANAQNFSVILHDISSRKRVDELKSEFTSIITHELQTPIAIMKIIVDNILRHSSKNLNSKITIGSVRDLNGEVNRLGLLVENVLDIAKLRTKKFTLNLDDIELTSLINRVVRKLRLLADENKPIIVHPAKKVTVLADQIRIEQVLMNLIDNAIKFTPKRGKVEIFLKVAGNMVTVSISNETDQLIPENKYFLIFDKFYQLTKNPVKGLGLGLYISREIIKKHQGKMWASSNKDNRNIFHFTLPIK